MLEVCRICLINSKVGERKQNPSPFFNFPTFKVKPHTIQTKNKGCSQTRNNLRVILEIKCVLEKIYTFFKNEAVVIL